MEVASEGGKNPLGLKAQIQDIIVRVRLAMRTRDRLEGRRKSQVAPGVRIRRL